MANWFGEAFQKRMAEAGQGVRKLTQAGRLKLQRLEAEAELRDRYRDLGRVVASLLIDRGQPALRAEDPAVAGDLRAVERARRRLEELAAEGGQEESAGSHGGE